MSFLSTVASWLHLGLSVSYFFFLFLALTKSAIDPVANHDQVLKRTGPLRVGHSFPIGVLLIMPVHVKVIHVLSVGFVFRLNKNDDLGVAPSSRAELGTGNKSKMAYQDSAMANHSSFHRWILSASRIAG